ncbi:MAG: hypothetical protein AB2707_14235, partial [Candidatus Thiodiazotropha sp.]
MEIAGFDIEHMSYVRQMRLPPLPFFFLHLNFQILKPFRDTVKSIGIDNYFFHIFIELVIASQGVRH